MSGSILILAGRRPGAVDALAEAHGVADKCLVPVAGRPMIAHVLESAADSDAERVIVSTHHADLLADLDDPVVDLLGDRLVVAVNSDAGVARLKGPGRPLVPARQRAELVAALACVDWVVVFREETPLALIRALRPDVLAKGGDWALDAIVGRSDVEGWGGRVVRLRQVPGVRTTALLERARRSGDR